VRGYARLCAGVVARGLNPYIAFQFRLKLDK
jgi:hypothetical protein